MCGIPRGTQVRRRPGCQETGRQGGICHAANAGCLSEHLLTAATTDSEDGFWEEKGQRNQESSEGAGSERGLGKDELIPRANLIFQTVISGLQEAVM